MGEREKEERRLAEADHHIARAKELIRLQRERIENMQAQGRPIDELEHWLSVVLETLAVMEEHRAVIADRLATLAKLSHDSDSSSQE